ncbi:MAG TPA: MFS transporter [Gaiellaceae bacterium]|nr:MFS transporter [Gaiellaceae bacterium]
MDPLPPRTRAGRRVAALLALGLAAVALRPQLTGIGPLLPAIQDDLHVSHLVAGLLPAIPIVCMGIFAPPAAYLSGWLGARAAVAACLAGIALFGFARAFAPPAVAVVALTVPIGIGMGFAGALLPVAVKERFADRPAFATGVYSTGINVGSALSAGLAVPVAHAAGGWRTSLAAFSGLAAVLLASWLALTPRAAARVPFRRPPRVPWRSGTGWLLVLLFGLDSMIFYGINSWLPDAYVERGWSDARAGTLLAVVQFTTIPFSFGVPWLADRIGSRRLYLTFAAGMFVVGTLGFVVVPGGAWAWAICTGIAVGAMFPIILTLPLDLAHRPADVGAFAALMLGGGYVLAAIAPLALGAVRDASGSFAVSLWLLVGLSVALVAVALAFSRERLAAATLDS